MRRNGVIVTVIHVVTTKDSADIPSVYILADRVRSAGGTVT